MIIFFNYFLIASTNAIALWPQPQNVSVGLSQMDIDPCTINYLISTTPDYLIQLKNHYLKNAFNCNFSEQFNQAAIQASFLVTNTSLIAPLKDTQNFTIKFDGRKFTITSFFYPGYVRAWQTFSQLFDYQKKKKSWKINYPIEVDDYPNFEWRALMIDSSRHYLKIDTIKKSIDALMYNKMNVLHWHIVDTDSFPMQVNTTHPQLAQYGSFGLTYTQSDIQQITTYALKRGIRIIPQIDSPSHTQSWGRAPQNVNVTIKCNNLYFGQFDPSQDRTYVIIQDVMKYVNDNFPDQVIHFGGDQIETFCWDKRPQIKEKFMKEHNLSTYKDLQVYYRKRQKQIFRKFSNKSAAYWANQDIDLEIQPDDIIHWWGASGDLYYLSNRTNRVVLSCNDYAYINNGFGGPSGGSFGNYYTWRRLYEFDIFIPNFQGVLLGAQTTLWSQLSNDQVQMRKSWIRTSVFGERTWNNKVGFDYNDIMRRISQHGRRLRIRGIEASAVSVELCERNPDFCFKKEMEITEY